jgi:addiction module HigA family antidote
MIAGLAPVHPGELLREDILPHTGKSKAEIVRMLRISRQSLYDVLDGKQSITAPMALRLGKLFGNSAEFWIRMQATYDLKTAAATMAQELEQIPTLEMA